jgi:tetratricopeptide (TPR) repeat protein
MQSVGKIMRNRLPALGLGLIGAFGFVAVVGATAPAALAQKADKSGKITESKEFVAAFTAAQTAQAGKDWNGVVASADTMASTAKTASGKQTADQFRVIGYANLGKKQEMLTAVENLLATGTLPDEQKKNFRNLQMATYSELKNDAKAAELTRAFIKDYGGTADQYAYLASYEMRQNDCANAIADANKSIDASKQAGQKPRESSYQILLKCYFDAKDNPNYYATVERVYGDYPKPELLRALIDRATKEPKFNRARNILDLYRALVAAKVELKPTELADMGEQALTRANSAESEKAFAQADKAGWAGIDATAQARYKKMYDKAQADAKKDAAGGLAASEKDAAASPKGGIYANVADAYLGAGDNAKAIELFQKAFAKGAMDEGETAYARLNLGVAQFRAGQKDDARKTWEGIKGDNGAAVLAHDWVLMSK